MSRRAGWIESLGLHPAVGIGAGILDWLCFTSELELPVAGWALAWILVLPVGIATAIIQRKAYGDGRGRAIGKALLVGALLVIPTPTLSLVLVPSTVIGLFRGRSRAANPQ